jgi:glutaryl-CoA dehydrogenase
MSELEQPALIDLSPTDNGSYVYPEFEGLDYYDLDELLTDTQKRLRDEVRAFVTAEVNPIIEQAAHDMEFPRHLVGEFARLGVIGPNVPKEYGGGGHDNIVYGLMMQEIERGDSGLRSFCSVMGSLVMYPIWKYGSEEQRKKWLPALASGKALGCFALTEPQHGSNPAGMETHVVKDAGGYRLTGFKRWSTNASEADVAVVWAKDETGVVRGFLVDMHQKGVSAPRIMDKWSLRAAITSEITFDEVRVSADDVLPGVQGLKGPLSCLTQARYGIAWGTVGAAMSCYDAAVQHSRARRQFGRPIGGFQLVQERLADMVQEITKAQLLNLRLGQMKDAGTMRPQHVSLAKRNNCQMALEVARSARQLLGGNGVLSMYPVMRHMMNLESVVTYEGTHEVHTLVIGQDVTGENAFT